MVQLMGSDGSATHCVSVVADVRHDEVRYIVVDSNEPCAMPLTNKVLALCTASNTCSGWKSILYLIANENLMNSEARMVRSSLQHTAPRCNLTKLVAARCGATWLTLMDVHCTYGTQA